MYKRLFFTILVTFATCTWAQTAQQTPVATVNDETITKNELDRAVHVLIPQTYFHASITEEKIQKVQKKALDKLIEKKLLIQYAKSLGIRATKGEIDAQELAIRKRFKDKKSFIAGLQKSNFDYTTFRKALEEDIILNKLYRQKIKTDFTDAQLKEYYENNLYKFKEPERIKVRIIYIKKDPTDANKRKLAKKEIKEVYEKAKSGENFADLAAKYSDAMSRIKGGDLGYIHKGMLDSDVDDAVFALNPGEISNIIENDKGYYIALVEAKEPQKTIPFEKTKEKLRRELVAKYEEKKRTEILTKLQKNAVIKRY